LGGLDDTFRTDWRDDVAGISLGMLREALQDANQFYVKPVEFREMLLGGIDAVSAVATTPGLERAFPALQDEAANERLLTYLKDKRKSIAEASPESVGSRQLVDLLNGLRMINSQTIQLEEEVLVSEFADGALATLDPFSNMIWPSQLAEFTKGTQGEFVGVGIQIRSEDNGDLLVVSPLPDSPAYEAGIQPSDIITHINGKSAKGISDTQAVTAITGEPGTKVTLTIKSVDGTVEDHDLARRQINVTSVKGWKQLPGGKWDYFVDPEEKIGYLRMTNFQKSTADELHAAIDEIKSQGSRAVILDLRYNPGGLLQSAVDVSDAFLGNAVVVSTRGDRPTEVVPSSVHRAKTDRNDLSLPLVVLVNEYSASASEIVSGALKDHERAMIVGKRTFGKGSVQMLYRLRTARGMPEALLKLTTAHYYLPSGKNIHKDELDTEWGVDPDVPVEMTPQQMRDAISARQALDVLREDGSTAEVTLAEEIGPVSAENALLDSDAQLSAAILLLRMELAGESVM
jgi:carboxyl-terminal processing protease